VQFVNDLYDGSAAADRNLYLDSITVDGHTYAGSAAASDTAGPIEGTTADLLWNGGVVFDLAASKAAAALTQASSSSATPSVAANETPLTAANHGTVAGHTLSGTSGHDVIQGGAGNDTLIGGGGADTLTGGAGHDTFVYRMPSEGGDTITDFHPGEDILDLHQLMHAVGYSGTDPVADHVLQLEATASGGTAVVIDPDGSGTAHAAQTLVTLEHVLPGALHIGSDLHWH
jgi:Ca2+-binding RTX toxin-like protein